MQGKVSLYSALGRQYLNTECLGDLGIGRSENNATCTTVEACAICGDPECSHRKCLTATLTNVASQALQP